jgi:hypothetical protein
VSSSFTTESTSSYSIGSDRLVRIPVGNNIVLPLDLEDSSLISLCMVEKLKKVGSYCPVTRMVFRVSLC